MLKAAFNDDIAKKAHKDLTFESCPYERNIIGALKFTSLHTMSV
jgi:hypothetical protein